MRVRQRSLLPLMPLLPSLTLGSLALALPAAGQCPGMTGGPTLETPGSATCMHELIAGGSRTTFTLTADTVLAWNDGMQVGGGHELVFDLVDGNGVLNAVSGGARIDGIVRSNGPVAIFADRIDVGGSVEAGEVVLAAGSIDDPAALFSASNYTIEAAAGSRLTVDGTVRATAGDAILAGRLVNLRGGAGVDASGSVRIGGGNEVAVAPGGEQRLAAGGSRGVVLHLGESRGATLELVGVDEVTNAGRLVADGPEPKVFLEVGSGGVINNEGSGVIIGTPVIDGAFDNDGVVLEPSEGDTAAVVNSAVLKLPAVRRPGGEKETRSRVVTTQGAATASSDAGRDRQRANAVQAARNKDSLLRRGSFFGMRGQSGGKKKGR